MPPPTPRQLDILILLYRFRFLNRIHIQQFLGHKNHSLIRIWLNDLATNGYVTQHYVRQITSAPTTYELTDTGRTYLKGQLKKKLARQTKYTDALKSHSLAVADTYFSLLEQAERSGATLHFSTTADLAGIPHLPKPLPDAYIAIEQANGETARYFLEVLEDAPSRILRAKVSRYFAYFESEEWQDHTERAFPTVLLICPNERLRRHLMHYAKSKAEEGSKLRFVISARDPAQHQSQTNQKESPETA